MATKAAKAISLLAAVLFVAAATSVAQDGVSGPAGFTDGGAAPQRREAALALPVATKLILALPGPAESIGVNDAAPSPSTSTGPVYTPATPSPAVAAPTCAFVNNDAAASSASSNPTSTAASLPHPTQVAAAESPSSSSSSEPSPAVPATTTDALVDTPSMSHPPPAVRTCSCECTAAAGSGRHPAVVRICKVLKLLKALGVI